MTITKPLRIESATTHQTPSLAALLDQIADDQELSPRERQDMSSALRTVARVLGRQPAEVPADPRFLRERLERYSPAMAGVSAGRWNNILSLTRRALKRVELTTVPGRYQEPLAPEWEKLFGLLNTRNEQISMSRLAHYCSANGISPTEVSDVTLGRFLEDIENSGIVKRPRPAHRKACLAWNRMAEMRPDWPQQRLTIPNYRKDYALPWSSFPASLVGEIEAYLDHLAGTDPVGDYNFKPLKPGSIKTRRGQLHQFISAVVHQGRDPQSLRSLADIVQIDVVKDGMRYLLGRMGKKKSKHAGDIAHVLCAIAKHRVGVSPDHLAALKGLGKQVDPGRRGMTDKNRERLRPFDDPANVRALLTLPQRLVAQKATGLSEEKQARAIQTALLIELLIMVPMRLGNLARLDIEKNLIRSRHGKVVHLVVHGDDVKNEQDIECVLPDSTVRLLDLYLADHRPKLMSCPSSWLFPGSGSNHRAPGSVRPQIVKCVRDECGLEVNPHLFRHIAAKIYLDANPGAYGTVRLVHGHKSVETTTKYYCGTETAAAMRHYDDLVLEVQRSQPIPRQRTQKGAW
jgi:integrase